MANLSEDLKIVISGDPKKFEAALDKVQAETKRLEAGLTAAAKVSGVAFAALAGTVTGLVLAFREQEVQEKKTAQLLEKTGNASGIAATKVFEYAAALQSTSIYGDEVILESQNILLSMAKLSEDGFKRASQTALDLAATMGGDLSGASMALGKALADPSQGIAALSRQGIKFSDEQVRVIKALDDTGKTAEAQAIILGALEKKFGGMAAAQAEGTGRFIQLKNAMGDVGEEIGRALVPALSSAAAAATPFFTLLANNQVFTKTAAAALLVGTAIAGLTLTIAGAALGYLKLSQLIIALNTQLVAQGITLAATRAAFIGAATSAFSFVTALGGAIISTTVFSATLLKNAVVALLSYSTYKNAATAATGLFSAATSFARVSLLSLVAGFFGMLTAIPTYIASMFAAATATGVMATAVKFLVGATGIGLIILVIADLAMNWDKRIIQMKAAWTSFVDNIASVGAGLSTIFQAIINRDFNGIKKGLGQIADAGKKFVTDYSTAVDSGLKALEDREKKSEQTKKEGQAEGHKARLSAETVFLEQMKQLKDQYDILRAEAQMTDQQVELLSKQEHQNALLEASAEYRAAVQESKVTDEQLDAEQELAFQTRMQEMRNAGRAAELDAGRQVALEKAQIQQKADLQFIKDREKFGVAYAKINQVIYSEQVQGAASAAGDLVALQQSTNSTLKGIGKAAAIADITIKTAQAAMNIYNGFSTIPIIGPALGIVGAAAAVAFGAERIGQVTAAADGGVVTGGMRGKDSIPAMLMPGELVTPTRNFDEVVNAVADSRLQDRGLGGGGSQSVEVTIGFKDDAFRIIEQKLTERRFLQV